MSAIPYRPPSNVESALRAHCRAEARSINGTITLALEAFLGLSPTQGEAPGSGALDALDRRVRRLERLVEEGR